MFLTVMILIFALGNNVESLADGNLYERLQRINTKNWRGLDLPQYSDWVRIPPYLQTVLTSIDDKLRGLETFGYTLKLAKLDLSLEQLVRRLDSIESKISLLQTKFDVRMEKVEDIVMTKDVEEEFSTDHLSRKLNRITEKLNNKFAFVDAKMELASERMTNRFGQIEIKLQSSLHQINDLLLRVKEKQGAVEMNVKDQHVTITNRIAEQTRKVKEAIKEDVTDRVEIKMADIDKRIGKNFKGLAKSIDDNNERVAEMKKNIERLDCKQPAIDKGIERIETTMKCLHNRSCSSTGARGKDGSGNPNITHEVFYNVTGDLMKLARSTHAKQNDLNAKVNHFVKKIFNSVQKMWRNSETIKSKLEISFRQGNRTKEYLKTKLDDLYGQVTPLSLIQPHLLNARNEIINKVHELTAGVNYGFKTILVAQNHFISSCQNMMKLQEELPAITLVLHSMLLEIRNKTYVDDLRNSLQNSNVELAQSIERLHETIIGIRKIPSENLTIDAEPCDIDDTTDVARLCLKAGYVQNAKAIET